MSDALKSNTTLAKLVLDGTRNRNNPNDVHQKIHFFHSHQIETNVGERGAASLSDALKSNTTLAGLYLKCGYKKHK